MRTSRQTTILSVAGRASPIRRPRSCEAGLIEESTRDANVQASSNRTVHTDGHLAPISLDTRAAHSASRSSVVHGGISPARRQVRMYSAIHRRQAGLQRCPWNTGCKLATDGATLAGATCSGKEASAKKEHLTYL